MKDNKLYDYLVTPRDENDPMMDCMDCLYEGREYGEIHKDDEEQAEVVCPKCGSYHYYFT